jgi:hypothetical protein
MVRCAKCGKDIFHVYGIETLNGSESLCSKCVNDLREIHTRWINGQVMR